MDEEVIRNISRLTGVESEQVDDILLRLHEIFECVLSDFYESNESLWGFSIIYNGNRKGDCINEILTVVRRFNHFCEHYTASFLSRSHESYEIVFEVTN